MTNYREILRLHSLGLNKTEIGLLLVVVYSPTLSQTKDLHAVDIDISESYKSLHYL